jgi:DNA-binding NtrC family response regulator
MGKAATSAIKILVVEDEPLLLMDAMDMVEDAGFVPCGASNADEALELLRTEEGIGVVFTDVDMPGSIDGVKLAHIVRKNWPPISIVVASAHARVTSADLPEKSVFFSKPYRPSLVVDTLCHLARKSR